jgi:hypothetical protein
MGMLNLLCSCSDSNTGGVPVERYIKIQDKSCIILSKNFDVRWRYGLPEVKASGQEDIVRNVVTEHTNHCLYISLNNANKYNDIRIPLNIATSNLSYFSATGYSKFDIKLMDEKKFTIELSNHAHGSVAGIVDKVYVYTHNNSSIDAKSLIAKVVKIYSTGDTDIKVHSTETLDIKSTGIANIKYLGNPKINKSISDQTVIAKM